MIGLTFQGQLGNQMFQYAAARVQAARLGCGLVIARSDGLVRAPDNPSRRILPHELFKAFPDLAVHPVSYWLARPKSISPVFRDAAVWGLFQNVYVQPSETDAGGELGYDDLIWSIKKRTLISGFFQSTRYFDGYESQIRDWFSPSASTAEAVARLMRTLPVPPSEMIAVHIRRCDYAGLTYNGGVWALPAEYHERVLGQFPTDAPIALFSDDPVDAARLLPRPPAWTAPKGAAATDLFLMAGFRRMVIANSTFSWWAAWLNTQPGKVVVAPEYFIGWQTKRWFPADIRVEGWTYV